MQRFLLLPLLLGLSACEIVGPDTSVDVDAPFVVFRPGHPPDIPDAAVRVLGAQWDGTDFIVEVRYGGGCVDHRFQLFWNQQVAESAPPQTTFVLGHDDGGGDPCRALITESVRFDLSEHFDAAPWMRIHIRPASGDPTWVWEPASTLPADQ